MIHCPIVGSNLISAHFSPRIYLSLPMMANQRITISIFGLISAGPHILLLRSDHTSTYITYSLLLVGRSLGRTYTYTTTLVAHYLVVWKRSTKVIFSRLWDCLVDWNASVALPSHLVLISAGCSRLHKSVMATILDEFVSLEQRVRLGNILEGLRQVRGYFAFTSTTFITIWRLLLACAKSTR